IRDFHVTGVQTCALPIFLSDTARLCMKEPALGLVPDLTGTKPLVELVGVNRAVELCLTARTVDAAEAERLRLAERVVADAELERSEERRVGKEGTDCPCP